jgi:hypothetical protein
MKKKKQVSLHGKEFMEEVNLCLRKVRGIKGILVKLEKALEGLEEENYNELGLAAIQDLNILLGGIIKIWDQWASGVSSELNRLIEIEE